MVLSSPRRRVCNAVLRLTVTRPRPTTQPNCGGCARSGNRGSSSSWTQRVASRRKGGIVSIVHGMKWDWSEVGRSGVPGGLWSAQDEKQLDVDGQNVRTVGSCPVRTYRPTSAFLWATGSWRVCVPAMPSESGALSAKGGVGRGARRQRTDVAIEVVEAGLVCYNKIQKSVEDKEARERAPTNRACAEDFIDSAAGCQRLWTKAPELEAYLEVTSNPVATSFLSSPWPKSREEH